MDNIKDMIISSVKNLHSSKVNELIVAISQNAFLLNKVKTKKRNQIRLFILQFIGANQLVKGTSTISRKYWALRGWPENEITIKVSARKDKFKPEYSIFSPKNKKYNGLSKEQVKEQISKFRPTSPMYWQNDAQFKEFQRAAGNKGNEKHAGRKDRTWTQELYWVTRGFSSEEAKAKVSISQDTRSLKFIMLKHGVLSGYRKYIKLHPYFKFRNELVKAVWVCRKNSTLNITAFNEAFIKEKQLRKGHASRESLIFFKPLSQWLSSNNKEFSVGALGKVEFKLYYNEKKYFRYDFVIHDKKLIIEYDGIYWHKKSSAIDEQKDAYAKKLGYNILRLPGLSNIRANEEINYNFSLMSSFLNNYNFPFKHEHNSKV